jgi:hypothetical protein
MIRDKLILALDVSTREEALALVERLHGYVGGFKVGLQLFHACGPAILHEVRQRGGRVFYDGKFHDIPHTVAGAVAEVTQAGVFMLNVHTPRRSCHDAGSRGKRPTGRRRAGPTPAPDPRSDRPHQPRRHSAGGGITDPRRPSRACGPLGPVGPTVRPGWSRGFAPGNVGGPGCLWR